MRLCGELLRVFQNGLFLLAAVFTPTSCALANPSAFHWPLPGSAPTDRVALETLLQPTRSGNSESALFGCVRNSGSRFHEGLDLAPVLPRQKGEAVDPVFSIHAGRVVYVNRVAGKSSYGRYVVVEHEDMRPAFYSLYAHLADIPEDLKEGEWIASGMRIGTLGRSAGGYSIPPERAHLHLEIGLRLSSQFQTWYDRQPFDSPNDHGNFNGMNLVGMDPVFYLLNAQDTSFDSGSIMERIAPAVLVQVCAARRPEILLRCPAMELPSLQAGALQGWEITLSAWGFPLSFKALKEGALPPGMQEGQVRILAVDADLLEKFACRELVRFQSGRPEIGRGGHSILELLFEGAAEP